MSQQIFRLLGEVEMVLKASDRCSICACMCESIHARKSSMAKALNMFPPLILHCKILVQTGVYVRNTHVLQKKSIP